MSIETIDDIVEEIADRLGIYGACKAGDDECPNNCKCRPDFISGLVSRIHRAIEVEQKLNVAKHWPVVVGYQYLPNSDVPTVTDHSLLAPKLSFDDVVDLVKSERITQDANWGTVDTKDQSCAGYLLVIESELEEAKQGWMKNIPGKHSALSEVVQIAAVCFACIEQFGSEGNPK